MAPSIHAFFSFFLLFMYLIFDFLVEPSITMLFFVKITDQSGFLNNVHSIQSIQNSSFQGSIYKIHFSEAHKESLVKLFL